MQEAIMKVRAELGRDAVILHSKKFRRGGAFGLFGRPMYEVIAAVDLVTEAGAQKARPAERTQSAAVVNERELAVGESVALPAAVRRSAPAPDLRRETGLARESLAVPAREERRAVPAGSVARPEVRVGAVTVPVAPEGVAPQVAPVPVKEPLFSERQVLLEELAGLRRMIGDLTGQFSAKEPAAASPGWEAVRRHLVAQELAPEHLKALEQEVFETCRAAELADRHRVDEVAREFFLRSFVVERRKGERPARRRVVALVGPTGVGKTTTVAKLAAQHALFGNKAVGLLTVDTYRIAAVDQLKTYAEIINLPVEVAYTPDEVAQAMGRLADRDLILMDTAGRSQKNRGQMAELQAYLAAAKPDEVCLVLSATTKQRDLEECLEQFRGTGYKQLIFTKLDESNAFGALYNCSQKAQCPISHLTFGQNVPDDIEEASRERLVELLLGTGVDPS